MDEPAPVPEVSPHFADPWFTSTHWSVVLAAGGTENQQATEALSRLAEAYRPAILGFARHLGFQGADAEDLTQGFFLHFIRNNLPGKVQRRQMRRFRSFLIAAFKNYIADERDRWRAAKRGGSHCFVSLEEWLLEEGEEEHPGTKTPCARTFDRQWAQALVAKALNRLESEYSARERKVIFDRLQTHLLEPDESPSYARLSTELGSSQVALRQELSRMRRRYGELFREEVANTVASPTEVAEEIRHLLTALAAS
jgi:RNA polymerase sigma-70 factor (ECF subfamily)